MSRTLFVDTFCFVAAGNRADPYHQRSVDALDDKRGRLLTTEFILLELADGLAARPGRVRFEAFLRHVRSNDRLIIVPATTTWFERGVNLYVARPDKGWSLTDCISFEVMREYRITEAWTGDHHFRQAGFEPLFLSE